MEKDDVLRGKGIDPDEQRLEEAIVSPPPSRKENSFQCLRGVVAAEEPLLVFRVSVMINGRGVARR